MENTAKKSSRVTDRVTHYSDPARKHNNTIIQNELFWIVLTVEKYF